jgi:hypothetical protein
MGIVGWTLAIWQIRAGCLGAWGLRFRAFSVSMEEWREGEGIAQRSAAPLFIGSGLASGEELPPFRGLEWLGFVQPLGMGVRG